MSGSAELQKLAHALDTDVASVQVVAGLDEQDLRALRHQIAEALFQAGRPAFARVAALSKAVPTSLSAKLSQAVLPPLLAARTAELLEPAKAVDLVSRLSDAYLADVSAYLDASRAPEVVAAIPVDRVATVGAELARRGEWVIIGGFVGQVDDPALRASVGVFDGEQLLRIGYVLDDLTRLDDIGPMLTDTQLDEILAAAPAHGLWPEFATLFGQLSPDRVDRLAGRFAAVDDTVRAGWDRAVADGELEAEVLVRLQAS